VGLKNKTVCENLIGKGVEGSGRGLNKIISRLYMEELKKRTPCTMMNGLRTDIRTPYFPNMKQKYYVLGHEVQWEGMMNGQIKHGMKEANDGTLLTIWMRQAFPTAFCFTFQ
jgi:hypothetical protein